MDPDPEIQEPAEPGTRRSKTRDPGFRDPGTCAKIGAALNLLCLAAAVDINDATARHLGCPSQLDNGASLVLCRLLLDNLQHKVRPRTDIANDVGMRHPQAAANIYMIHYGIPDG